MSMVTTCPGCHTTFSVTTGQLNAHQGDVRCGNCGKVFNAFDSLAPHRAAAPADLQPAAEAPEAAPAQKPAPEPEPVAAFAEEWDAAPVPFAATEVHEEARGPEPASMPAGLAEETATTTAAPAREYLPEPEAPAAQPAARKPAMWGWISGTAVLALLLAAQSVFLYRTEIAANYPDAGPYLRQACGILQCTVPLPRDAELLKIEASDLVSDPAQPKRVTLSTLLSNHAKFRLAWPALELTLTNAADETVARRIFQPAEYLRPGTSIQAGMAPLSEVPVKLDLDVGDLSAAGYRLYVFYP
jgi:predicted Zn finger-like uncharacterized protein